MRVATDAGPGSARQARGMIGNGFQTFSFVVLTASAGLLMALSGLHKRLLRRKQSAPRCPTCGRSDRYNCACRR